MYANRSWLNDAISPISTALCSMYWLPDNLFFMLYVLPFRRVALTARMLQVAAKNAYASHGGLKKSLVER
jgi:hypothetical protein